MPQQDWIGEPGAEAMSEAMPARRERHSQEQIAWRVGALIVGGAVMALGLGWAARVFGMHTE